MADQPSHQDTELILRLYELRREEKMREARTWFAESFKPGSLEELQRMCPPGSQTNAYFRMVISYWEMAASFVSRGVLHKKLFFDSGGEMLLVWTRLEPIIGQMRQAFKDDKILSHLQRVSEEFIAWKESRAEGSYQAFKERVG